MASNGQYSTASPNQHHLDARAGSVPTLPADGSRYALTAYQRDIWTSNELTPGAPNYVTAMVVHLVGDVDTDELVQCLAHVWERNDGLRLQFGTFNGVPYQVLAEKMPPIEWRNVTAAADPATAAQALMRAMVDTPI